MNWIVIDVREPDEYAKSHVDGAINVPLGKIISGHSLPQNIAKNDQIILYCNSGNRSGTAKRMLEFNGYQCVINGIDQRAVEAHLNN